MLTETFDLFFYPLKLFSPFGAILIVSLVTGLLMLWVFGRVSNQKAIASVKQQIKGNLLAVRIYQHDVGVVLRSQGRVLRQTLSYMRLSIFPMLVLIVPVALIIIQLNLRFSVRPLLPGEHFLLKIKVRNAAATDREVSLEVPEGVKVETPPVRIPSAKEIDWRLGATAEGLHILTVKVGDESSEKELVVGSGWGPVSAVRTGGNLWDSLLYPGERPIPPQSQIARIELRYPPQDVSLLGWNIHWLLLFFILSVGFGYALKGFFGIEV